MASSAMRTTVMALERVFDGDDFAALVVAALRADPVRQLGLVALRARRRRLRFEEVMRAARAGAGLRMAALWIWHRLLLNDLLFRQLLPDGLQRAPALVNHRALARARLAVPIRAALRAEPEAALVAQRLHRNRELNRLRRELLQRKRPLREKLHIELVAADLELLVFLGSFWTSVEW